MRSWTLEDNYAAMGYLKFAIEHYNKYSVNGDDYQTITEDQAHRLVRCMYTMFDEHTEEEAYTKG